MADTAKTLKDLCDEVAKVADIAATVLPQAAIAGGVARIGGKFVQIIDDLMHHAPDDQSADAMDAARQKLMAAVSRKADATSARLRG